MGSIPIMRIGSLLLTTVQVELRDQTAEEFQTDLLAEIEKTDASGLVVDISGLDMVDSYVARILAETAQMAKLMGTETVLVGMRPEVAATLVQMGYMMTGVRTAINVEIGMSLLGHVVKPV
jgi:rsbT antagonist protein RsbS